MFFAQIIVLYYLIKYLHYQISWLYAFFINFYKKRVRECVLVYKQGENINDNPNKVSFLQIEPL